MRISVSIRGIPELRAQLQKLQAPKLHRPMREFLLKAAHAVLVNAAETQILRGGRVRGPAGPRGGKGKLRDTKPHPSKLTSRSGELRRSLSVNRGSDRSGLPRYIDVGSDLVYARVHELGLGRFPRRAFLVPAAEAVAPKFRGLLAAELAKVLS